MGNERATIEDEEKFFSPMQLNSPAQVAMDAGGGQGEPMSQDQRQQFQQAIRGRGPSLFGDLEQIVDQVGADQENNSDDDSDDNGGRQSSAPLIQEEEVGDEEAGLPQRALDKSGLMQDIWGARDLKEEVGANPYRGVIEAGEILQGGANAARRRGEGRYGAAALHSLGGLAVGAANAEGGVAAGGAAKTALKPFTAAALPLTLAKDAAKYTVGNLISTAGQAVQKVGDSKRDAADPEGILENQRLIDLKNQHEFGYDTTSTEKGRTREQDVAERGVRFEDGDNAKRIWEGPKKRTWGRIAQNAVAAPFRGIGKAFKGLVTSPAAAFKSMVNPIAKYGRKFGNWVSNNSWNRKRRANNALERLRARTDPNNANPHPAEAEGALKADSPLGKNRMLNFRGADAAIRSHTRDVRQAQGFDNILGQKDYEKLNQADRVDYRERERALLTTSPKYANMADSFTQDSDQIRSIAQQFDVEPAAAQGPDAEQNLPPLIGEGDGEFENLEEKDAPRLGEPKLAKDSHAGASAMEGVDKAVKYGAKIALELPQKAAPAVDAITHVLGKTVPDMLEGQALEDYAPTAEAVTDIGEGYNKYTAGAGLYRAPLIAKGVGTAVDLFRTANQYRNRDKDPNETALNERRTLEDTREMSNRVRALLQAKKDSGASEESIARTKRLRNKMLMHRLVTANRKLAKAQEMNGITPLNEYSKKESDFVRSDVGEYSKDEEVGAKGPGELAKEFGKNTKKIFGAFVGDTNTADSTSEAERLYPPNLDANDVDDVDDVDDAEADPQLRDAGAHQSVIEDEEKRASGELSAGGNSQLGAIGVNQNVIKEEVNLAPGELDPANRVPLDLSSLGHASGELNVVQHPDTNLNSQRQRPSQVDFDVSDNDDDNDNAVAAGGGGVRVDQPSDAGLDPDLLAQMNQFEGAENSMDGNPLGNSIRRVSDFHDSVRSDGTALERMGSVVDDFQEQPMGGQGPQGPALGNGPMLNHLVDGQWQMMQEEEKGVPVEEEKGAPAHGALPNVNTGSGAVNVASEALLNRMHATKPAVWPNIKPWRHDDLNRESPAYNVSESEAAEYQGLMAGEGMKDVSTRHEGLDLPSARVHVPSDTSDLPEWVSEFSGPGGELDFFDNEDEKFELGKDVIQNVDKYAPIMAKKSGPEETINRVFDGYKSNDKERDRLRKKFLDRERVREEGIDIASKKMLEGDPADRVQNRQKLQIPTEDAMTNSGPMTIGGHEVVPEMKNKYHDPRKPQGGWWSSAATGQKLGWAGLAGSKPLASPFGIDVAPFGELWQGHVVAGEKKREVRAKAKLDGIGSDALGEQLAEVSEQGRRQGFGGVADQGIVQTPAAGWGNIGKKPGMFAGKKAKEDYKQKTKAIDPVIDDAWGKMKGEEMPSFMKGVPYAEKKWREKERDQRALEEQEALRKKWGMGAEKLRGL